MAAKKEDKLDKGFDEVPVNLDEGFEEAPQSAPASAASPAPAPGPTQGEALARGLGKGVTFGAQPVLAGAGAAATQALTGNQGPVQGRNLPALLAAYKQMQAEQVAKNAAAQQAFPKTFGAAQFAGSIPTAVATGGANPGLGTMAAQGAGAGLGTYLGDTTKPNIKDATISTGAGLMGGAVMHQAAPGIMGAAADAMSGIKSAAGKLVPQSMKEGYAAGQEGINLLSNEAKQKVLPEESSKAADNITNRILNTNAELRKDIDSILQQSTKGGMIINHETPMAVPEDTEGMQHFSTEDGTIGPQEDQPQAPTTFQRAFDNLDGLVSSDASYGDASTDSGKMAQKLFNKITQYKAAEEGETPSGLVDKFGKPLSSTAEEGPDAEFRMHLTPLETRNLANDIGEYAKVLASNKEGKLAKIAYDFSKGMKERLRAEVPEYGDAADRLTQFQQYVPETLMSQGERAADTNVRLSDSASQYQDIKDPAQQLISKLSKTGTGTDIAKQTYNRLDESLDQLATLERARQSEAEVSGKPFSSIFEKLGMNKDQIMDYLKSKSQRAAAYDMMKTGSIPIHTPKTFTQAVADVAGKTGVATGNMLGRASNVGGIIYNAPKDVLYAAAAKLEKNPAVAHLAAGLKSAISSGDITKQNAALFAIMQNPTAKAIIDPNINSEQGTVPAKKQPYDSGF